MSQGVSITRGVPEGNRDSAVPLKTVRAAPRASRPTAPAPAAQDSTRNPPASNDLPDPDLGYGRRGKRHLRPVALGRVSVFETVTGETDIALR
jgi:hypothetical protein